jgi:hypothetical protein
MSTVRAPFFFQIGSAGKKVSSFPKKSKYSVKVLVKKAAAFLKVKPMSKFEKCVPITVKSRAN